MQNPSQPGFVLPPQQNAGYPSYPSQPPFNPSHPIGQPGYPATQQPVFSQAPVYPPQPAYQHQPFPAPIQQQPATGGLINYPDFQDRLRNATSFHVKQNVELLEAIIGFETENRYTVKDQAGNKIFLVSEQTNCCSRQCFGKQRPFVLNVRDTNGVEVLTFERELDCGCCFGLFCPGLVKASRPNGQAIGFVQEEHSFLHPKYAIKDAQGNVRLGIKGPFCPTSFGSCQPDVVFQLRSPDKVVLGSISKHWSGLLRELFTDADYFSISFPMELDPSLKAACLAGLFMIVSSLNKSIKNFQILDKNPTTNHLIPSNNHEHNRISNTLRQVVMGSKEAEGYLDSSHDSSLYISILSTSYLLLLKVYICRICYRHLTSLPLDLF